MEFSVIYPVFNEEHSLEETIKKTSQALRPLFSEYEIIVIDDGSTDASGKIAEEMASEYPELRVVHNSQNLGQGESLMIGFNEAHGDFVLHNAADYPFDLNDLSVMFPLMENADIVVAVRRHRAGYTGYRRVLSAANLFLLRMLFPLNLRDYNFVQLYRRKVFQTVQPESRSTAFLTPEILIRAHDLGYRIAQIDVEYHARAEGVATAGRPSVVLTSVADMLRFWVRRTIQRRIKKNQS